MCSFINEDKNDTDRLRIFPGVVDNILRAFNVSRQFASYSTKQHHPVRFNHYDGRQDQIGRGTYMRMLVKQYG